MSRYETQIRVRVGKNGRITLPKWVRNDFDIREGDIIYVYIAYKLRDIEIDKFEIKESDKDVNTSK